RSIHLSAFESKMSILRDAIGQDRHFLDPHQFARAVASVGATERTAPSSNSRTGCLDQFAAQMNERASAQRFAPRRDLCCRWNHMNIRAVGNNLIFGNRR